MKLSNKQKEVIEYLRDGKKIVFKTVPNHPCHHIIICEPNGRLYVGNSTINALRNKKLINKNCLTLSELGKSIKL